MVRTKYSKNRKPTAMKITRSNGTAKRLKTRRLRQQSRRAFKFEESYYFHVPHNYIDDEFEDAEVKQRFIHDPVEGNELFIKHLDKANLDNICKEHRDLTNNIKMQSSGSLVLYIEKFGEVVAATSLSLDYDTGTNYEDINSEEEEENGDEWKVNEIRILTFCSKSRGYGKKLMNKIIALLMIGNDNGYVTDDVRIVLNCTESSKSFYDKQGFACDNNNLCTLMPLM